MVISDNLDSRRVKSTTLSLDLGSDHYCIITDVNTHLLYYKNLNHRAVWHIPEDADWDQFTTDLGSEWEHSQNLLENLPKENGQHYVDQVQAIILGIYNKAAGNNFKFKKSRNGWKPWITSQAQAACIRYHKWERYMRKGSHSAEEWKKLKELRKEKNRLMKFHKKRWVENKFKDKRLEGRDGWQIAAEIRNLYKNKDTIIPTIITDDNRQLLEVTDKANEFNKYYHRFDDLPILPEETFYDNSFTGLIDPELLSNFGSSEEDLPPEELEECEDDFEDLFDPMESVGDLKLMNPELNMDNLYKQFTDMSITYQTLKKNRCVYKHKQELRKLNAPITKIELNRAISTFDNHRASGPDDIDIRFIKHSLPVSEKILLWIYNLYFHERHCIPKNLKNRFIIPILKPGKPANKVSSYRPISLTSYFAKILEKILCYRLVSYLIHLQLLADCHFAYLRARSTQDAVTYILDHIYESFARKKETHAVFFDFSAAFDCVRINILEWKLKHEFHITGNFILFIRNFFMKRESAVLLGNVLSDWYKDTIGVPQGGSLSPILYLLYINGLDAIGKSLGLRFCIYADDLSIFTTVYDHTVQNRLQFGVFFIQWYSANLGLYLNMEKTWYQLFTRKIRSSTINLYFDVTVIHRVLYPDIYVLPDGSKFFQKIKRAVGAIRYLGFYLDPALNWKIHCGKLRIQCLRTFYSIQKNLGKIWRISTEVAWKLYESCVISILDYSAIIFGMCHKGNYRNSDDTLFGLRRLFKQVIKSVSMPVIGTPLAALYHHLCTIKFDFRWKKIIVQYFAHLLRLPKSGCLYKRIKYRWWKIIIKWARLKWLYTAESKILTSFKNRYIKGSHILDIIKTAVLSKYTDLDYINHTLRYDDINHKVSFYMDYTMEWGGIEWIPDNFTDEDLYVDIYNRFHADDLLVFTDGSVWKLFCGYGIVILRHEDYLKFKQIYDDDAEDFAAQIINGKLKSIIYLENTGLTARGSVDYGEAAAIYEAVLYIAKMYQEHQQNYGLPPLVLLNVQTIRFVTDSQTVLKWLMGEYRIKTTFMKFLIEGILWNKAYLEEAGYIIIFQYAPAHTNIFGNEIADRLAKSGMQESQERASTIQTQRQFSNEENWRYINFSVVNNLIKVSFQDLQQQDYRESQDDTSYGIQLFNGELDKISYRKDILRNLNRIEYRWWLAINTGHDWFNFYQFNKFRKGNSGDCDVCNMDRSQTVTHFLTECDDPFVYDMRKYLQEYIWTYYHEVYTDNLGRDLISPDNLVWDKLGTYFGCIISDIFVVKFNILRRTLSFLAVLKRTFFDR